MHMFFAPGQTANLFSTVTLVHTLWVVGLCDDFNKEIEAKPTRKTAVTYFILNEIEHPHAKRANKKGKKIP